MNEKLMNQVNEMKKQTIGVEIEMNNITREKPQRLPLNSSEQTDTRTQQEETATRLFQPGTDKAENGSSKRT